MIRSPTSRLIQQRSRQLHVIYGSSLRRYHRRTAIVRVASSSLTNLVNNHRNDDESLHRRYIQGVPQTLQVRLFSATTTTGGVNSDKNDNESSLRERASEGARRGAATMGGMARQYGPVFVGAYGTLYLATLGSIYGGIQSGALDPVALMEWIHPPEGESAASTVHVVVEWMEHYNFTKPYAPVVEKHPYVANLAVAWIATKFTEPIRFGVTLVITPRLARYFGYATPTEESDEKATKEGAVAEEEKPETVEEKDATKEGDTEAKKEP